MEQSLTVRDIMELIVNVCEASRVSAGAGLSYRAASPSGLINSGLSLSTAPESSSGSA